MTTTTQTLDKIEKQVLLKHPRSRVWRAITTPEEFGAWFRVKLSGQFTPGATIRGPIEYPGYEHLTFEATVERMEPEHLFSFRWHPYAIEPGVDYSAEPTTLVVFTLQEVADGTLLTVVESGFARIPAERRAEAFRMNDQGWGEQMNNITRYLSGPP